MIFERLSLGVYGANCYIVGCEKTKEAIVVDPGGNCNEILEKIEELELKFKYIILTHGHGDHVGAVPELKKMTGVHVLIHSQDEALLMDAEKNLSSVMYIDNVAIKPDRLLKDGDKISFGELEAEVVHTPGHTQGSICIKIDDNILSGDTLFSGSIGRTDLIGGSFEDIIPSIKNRIMRYNDDIKVFPGHGPATTVGKERLTNPFIKK